MLDILNNYSIALTVIFTGVVALATITYAILTWKLASETRKMREAQTEPKISVTIQPREEWINLIDLVIQNIGLGPAYNIKFEVEPDFEYSKGRYLSEIGLFKNGLNYLAPNQKMQFFLTSMVENFEEKSKTSITFNVFYENSTGNKRKDKYIIDFSQLIGLIQLGDPPLYKIAKNIESIKKDIHNLSTGFHKLKIIRYTKEEINKEMEKFLKQQKKTSGIK